MGSNYWGGYIPPIPPCFGTAASKNTYLEGRPPNFVLVDTGKRAATHQYGRCGFFVLLKTLKLLQTMDIYYAYTNIIRNKLRDT